MIRTQPSHALLILHLLRDLAEEVQIRAGEGGGGWGQGLQVSKADGRPAGSTNGQYIEGRVRTFLAVVGLVFELVR
jgi:hypothetical protein